MMKKLPIVLILWGTLLFSVSSVARQLPSDINVAPLKVKSFKNAPAQPTSMPEKMPMSKVSAQDLDDGDAIIYAYKIFGYGEYTRGLFKFQAYDPMNYDLVAYYGIDHGDLAFSSATMVEDEYWVYAYECWSGGAIQLPIGVGTIDIETGEFTLKCDLSEVHPFNECLMEMSYDPVTKKVYGMQYRYVDQGYTDPDAMNLWAFDPFAETIEVEKVGTIDSYLITMAANNGIVYGITQEYTKPDANGYVYPIKAKLIKFDPTNPTEDDVYQTEFIADLDNGEVVIDWNQTMEFDHSTHKLWWAAQLPGYDGGFIAEIDIKTGELSHRNTIPDVAQYVAMAIPYQQVSDEAPAFVTECAISVPEGGEKNVTISWINPTQTYQLEPLTELTGIKIYRNGVLLEDIPTTEIGGKMTFTDTPGREANYTYTVAGYNSAGEGLKKDRIIFVGVDVPAKVQNIKVVPNGVNATLTWEAPTTGKYDGWIDVASLTYDVYRGETLVSDNQTTLEFVDQVDKYDHYVYTIIPSTLKGEGVAAQSASVSFGPTTELPYENDMEDPERAVEMSVIDANNDDNTWYYTEGLMAYTYIAHFANDANDYLATPPLKVDAGKNYEVVFEYYTSNYTTAVEDFEVVIGDNIQADRFTTSIAKFENLTADEGAIWHKRKARFTAEGDAVSVAFRIYSAVGQGFVSIRNIFVREVGDSEASVESISGEVDGYVNTPATFTVVVNNEGNLPATDVVVKLQNAMGKVMAETEVKEIAVGESVDVDIAWIPSFEGDYEVYAAVSVEGDSYKEDNVTADFIRFTVFPEVGDRYITIGKITGDLDDRVIITRRKNSWSEFIYYSDEFNMSENIFITGLRFTYNASEESERLTDISLLIALANSDKTEYEEAFMGGSFMDENEFTVVFDGIVNMAGLDPEYNVFEVKFDKVFEYDVTRNLVVKLYKESSLVMKNPLWHVDYSTSHPSRGSHWNSDKLYDADPYNTAAQYVPYTKFSYKDPSDVEEININESDIKIYQLENVVTLSKVCETIDVYNLAGAKVASVEDADYISTADLIEGIYVVKATDGTSVATQKILVK